MDGTHSLAVARPRASTLRVALTCLAIAAMPLAAHSGSDPDWSALDRWVQETKDATLASATAIAIVKDGRIVHEAYFGYSDIQARTPASGDTVFYIASATKPFFALNALLKEEAGRLDMRTSLRQMFPQARFAGIDADSTTFAQLLTHTSGVDNQALVWATAYSGAHDQRSLAALVAASYPNADAARGTFDYSNVGYNIASVWMDRRFGQPWQEQLERAIFRPLGMRRTSAYISRAQAGGWPLAKPYSFAGAQPAQPLYLTKSDDTMHAAGGLVSTAPDLAKFLIAELSGGTTPAIPKDVIARSQATQVALSSEYLDFPRTGYAWGWYTGDYKGRRLLHHFGAFPGFHSHLSFMPAEGIGLVVLNNEDALSAQTTNLIADYVYGALLHEPGIAAKASRRFGELQAKARKLTVAAAEHREKIRAREWKLSLPREDYAGTYSNDLLGDVTVRLDADRNLSIRWGRVAAVATAGEAADQVRVEFAPNAGNFLDFKIRNGEATSLSFDRMVFEKARK